MMMFEKERADGGKEAGEGGCMNCMDETPAPHTSAISATTLASKTWVLQ